MKVVHVNSVLLASSVFMRLSNALQQQGIDSKMIIGYHEEAVEDEAGNLPPNVYEYQKTWKRKLEERTIVKYWNKFTSLFQLEKDIPFNYSFIGKDITEIKEIKEADLIHLHWICNFQSAKTINKLLKLGKPIVWTCSDSWPFTGGCHVRFGCEKFVEECEKCKYQLSGRKFDLAKLVFKNKMRYLYGNDITLIAPSNWMGENIKKSFLFGKNRCEVIPNPINIDIFKEYTIKEMEDKLQYKKERSKIHLLFGAIGADSPHKGYAYLLEMLEILKKKYPEVAQKIVLHIAGYQSAHHDILGKYENKKWGYISDNFKMACLYSLADIFVFPTLDDNLPGMVMESLACGTPVLTFSTGGVADMIEHKRSGYIAKYRDNEDFLNGLFWILDHNEDNRLGAYGRSFVRRMFNYKVIADQHIKLYKSLILTKNR